MANEKDGGTAAMGEFEIDLADPAVAARFADLGGVCVRYLEMFAPHVFSKLTPENLQGLLLGILREELMIDAQVRPLFTLEAAKDNDSLILQVIVPGQTPVNFQAKRRLEHCKNAQEIIAQILLVAFTDAPGLRAVLRVHGVGYMWLAPKQSRIILAKG
jgi:hypothetical protein